MPDSPYQAVWLVALFDLPTDTPEARKAYSEFRKSLLKDGFGMMQYSVYGRYCASEEKAKVHRRRIAVNLPPDGEVRVVTLTDVQYGKMEIFHGKMRRPVEEPPQQVELF